MEELISFKTAKLAKEKGFDWECTDGYGSNGKEYLLKDCEELDLLFYNWNSESEERDRLCCISAPSQSLLQKWLRDKHNMHVDLWYNDLTDKWRLEGLYLLPIMEVLSINCNEHPTYEQALEEGLYEALKLITTE